MQVAPDPSASALPAFDRERTAAALPFEALAEAIEAAAHDLQAGRIASPERTVLPLGAGGVLLSMPATSHDLGIHKLVTVQPANAARQWPTIHGIVTVCDAASGRPLCLLDGPEVTGRRTAAVSMVALRRLLGRAPRQVLLIGTGVQARHHARAVHALFPDCTVLVRGRSDAAARAFCAQASATGRVQLCPPDIPDPVDAVVTLTTATEPVYDLPAREDRAIVGVGAFKPDMAEIGRVTLEGSMLYADDPAGARHEAGDLIRAGVDWNSVRSLASLLAEAPDRSSPLVFKSVGTAAWDLAAARVAVRALGLGE